MAVPYIPARDADLANFANAFTDLIVAAPTTYGLVAGQATILDGFRDAYVAALAVATNISTRTTGAVAAKDVAKANLLAYIRALVAIIQGWPDITPTLLSDLGLTVRSTTRTPIPAPVTFPLLSLISIMNLQARFTIADELTPDSRSRPVNVIGCNLWYQIGGVVPTSTDTMTFAGLKTRSPETLTFPGGSAGDTVYMIGKWVTQRGLVGPQSSVLVATIA